MFKQVLGGRLKPSYDTVLEIGAGTGRSTLSFLRAVQVKNLLVTDISAKMLSILRRTLAELGAGSAADLQFATFSGDERCFAENRFDLAFGLGILHHILDYKQTLSILLGALKPGGVAVFNEPALDYYRALVFTSLEVFQSMQEHPEQWNPSDVSKLIEWTNSVYYRIKYLKHPEFLGGLEDKHLFRGTEFSALAKAIGFEEAEFFPVYPMPHDGRIFDHPELTYLGLTPTGGDRFQAAFRRHLPGLFGGLAEQDFAPAYVFLLKKPERARPKAPVRSREDPAAPGPGGSVTLAECEYALTVLAYHSISSQMAQAQARAGVESELKFRLREARWRMARSVPALLLALPSLLSQGRLKSQWREWRTARSIASSRLFSARHYLQRNEDVRLTGMDPLIHFVRWGAAEGRDPAPWFDTKFYLSRDPDAARPGVNPLLRFIRQGWRERRNPHPNFDMDYYLSQNAAVARSGENPLVHFVRRGWREGRPTCAPSPATWVDLGGWIVAPRPVERVRLEGNGCSGDFAVGYLSLESRHGVPGPFRFPVENAAFSGVVGAPRTHWFSTPPGPVAVKFKLDNGQWLPVGTVDMTSKSASTLSSAGTGLDAGPSRPRPATPPG